jgi:meso-butanediol dehydrogenase/(S,S)-butanediol dehydrogenase/diacetyl reductase
VNLAPGRLALVTGGASGFGLATARALADRGASVVIADVVEDKLKEAANADPRLIPVAFDVTDAAAVAEGVASARAALRGLDTLVLCAGVIHVKPLDEVTERDWDLTLDENHKRAFLVSQAAAPALRESGRGRIVAIASDAARRGYAWYTAYCASKFGLVGLCESLAIELAPARVTVNCVLPASCPTTGMGQMLVRLKSKVTKRSEEEVLASIASSFPLGRYVDEADVVNAILYFVSDDASFLTGVSLDIDGGEHLGYTPGLDQPQDRPDRQELEEAGTT